MPRHIEMTEEDIEVDRDEISTESFLSLFCLYHYRGPVWN